jgi:hypothetical protein
MIYSKPQKFKGMYWVTVFKNEQMKSGECTFKSFLTLQQANDFTRSK